jgi:hypothetical protein
MGDAEPAEPHAQEEERKDAAQRVVEAVSRLLAHN